MPHQIYKYDKPTRVTADEAKSLLRYIMGIPGDVNLDAFLIIGITTTPMTTTECISLSNWSRNEEKLIVALYQNGVLTDEPT